MALREADARWCDGDGVRARCCGARVENHGGAYQDAEAPMTFQFRRLEPATRTVMVHPLSRDLPPNSSTQVEWKVESRWPKKNISVPLSLTASTLPVNAGMNAMALVRS